MLKIHEYDFRKMAWPIVNENTGEILGWAINKKQGQKYIQKNNHIKLCKSGQPEA